MDENGSRGHLLFVPSPSGYRLEERQGDPPAAGSELEQGDKRFLVAKVTSSPLPGDRRACAYLLPA